MRVAAIDCGTNTLRLFVGTLDADGSLRELDRRLTFVGLGEGVDATGRFAPDAGPASSTPRSSPTWTAPGPASSRPRPPATPPTARSSSPASARAWASSPR